MINNQLDSQFSQSKNVKNSFQAQRTKNFGGILRIK